MEAMMHFGVYRFEGEPAALLAGYERLLSTIPSDQLLLHVCVERPGAIEVYDACPTIEAFEAFAASREFRDAVEGAGLPRPSVTRLGDVRAAFVQGKRVG
jgi:hypothetical protein